MAQPNAEFLLQHQVESLSDGSQVHNVFLGGRFFGGRLKIACTSRQAAEEFAEAVNDAINSDWTVNTSDILFS